MTIDQTSNRGYAISAKDEGFALEIRDRPVPQPGPGEVLIRIEAASLNFRDLLVAGRAPASGVTPLSDGAGVVEALGDGVAGLAVGDRVMPGFFQAWADGPFQAAYGPGQRGGLDIDGVLTRYVSVPAAVVVGIPDALSFEEAATLPCAAVTAWVALFDRYKLQPDDVVVVQGTGGVAIFGLQLATAAGARVIVTSSSDAKLEQARELGAWGTINYVTHPDWDQEVVRLTEGRGANVILELGGKGTFERSILAVAAGGAIAQIGGLAGFGASPNLLRLQQVNASIHALSVGSAAHLAAVAAFIATKAIKPVIDTVFAFEEAPAAFDALKAGRHFGKLVIRL